MAHYSDDEVFPVRRITAGALGDAGRRVFVLQVQVSGQTYSWLIAKEQALALSRMLPTLLSDVRAAFPELDEPLVASEPDMALAEPVWPQFRVGSIGVGYDRIHDLVVLILADTAREEAEGEELLGSPQAPTKAHVYTTRGQALLLSHQAETVVAAGRPFCPNCGEPVDEFGHFCLSEAVRRRRGGAYVQ